MTEQKDTHNNSGAVTQNVSGGKHGSASFILLLVAVLFSVALNGWFAWDRFQREVDTSPPVLVIDPYALQHAKKETLLAAGMTDFEQVVLETEKFAVLLDAVLNDYRVAGFVVVNRSAVIAAPEGLDITETVAQRLNLNVASR